MAINKLKLEATLIAKPQTTLFLTLLALTKVHTPIYASTINLVYPHTSSQIKFAVNELEKNLVQTGQNVKHLDLTSTPNDPLSPSIYLGERNDATIRTTLKSKNLSLPDNPKAESFSIRTTDNNNKIWVIGADNAGAMYGGLELAETIAIAGLSDIQDIDQSPYMAMRGTKFNIPLDVRTPSYTDVSDAAQKNMGEIWKFSFWTEYIDSLAKHRYNFISFWNLHPFPSLVRVPDYPDVALNDVQRSTVHWKEMYNTSAIGFDAPEIVNNRETIKRLTIDEKIAFWKKVMRYAKDRNIDIYFITWNIFVNGTNGKYGITDDIDNSITIDYMRKSVKQMFLTYPELKGIGLTTGENMYNATFEEKEDWVFKTYGLGTLDAAEKVPNRKITFIHRQHMTKGKEFASIFKPLFEHPNIEFIYSFKYAKAHVYSSTTQTYHNRFVKDIRAQNQKTIWTLRNDDIFHFRWGAPNFVREFIKNIPYDVSRGYYYGSDQYVWGREFLSRHPDSPRKIEIDKHWYHWMLWGRLGYDPNLNNDRFIQIIQQKFPDAPTEKLFNAWQAASMIYPITTGFHWGPLDFQWYIEACQSLPGPALTESGYHDVNRFISLKPHPGTNNVSIPDYVKQTVTGKIKKGTTPIQVANALHTYADKALNLLNEIKPNGSKELYLTVEDIKAMAYLGKFYANKIAGATELALFRETGNLNSKSNAIKRLQQGALYWRYYAATALSLYHNPLWTNRVGHVDWRKLARAAVHDITIAGGPTTFPHMEPTPGGIILEAENAIHLPSEIQTMQPGYTGKGYIAFDYYDETLQWNFNAPKAGTYILEFRYTVKINHEYRKAQITANDSTKELTLWNGNETDVWCWDRLPMKLNKGENKISFKSESKVLLDHLNVLTAPEL